MKHKFNLSLIFAALLLSSCSGASPKGSEPAPSFEPDNIVYDDNNIADFNSPHFLSASDEEEEEEQIETVNKVILHYVNDDGQCLGEKDKGRAFYVWVPGIDGQEYSDEYNKDPSRVKYEADGTMMTITIDMLNDEMFKPFFGSTSLMYIIKWKMKSESDLNWGGQSEDVELKYANFPPVDGVVEVWCTPAAGGGIAQFATEAETKVDGIKLAYFTDWKTITCTLTDNSTEVSWSLFAFDETYYKVKAKNRSAIKKNYKVKEGKSNDKIFPINLTYSAHINVVYCLESKDTSSTTGLMKTVYVSFEKLYGTPRFEAYYNYDGNDLGMHYTPEGTTFKVWSPVAANISVLVYDTDTSSAYGGTDKYKGWHMNYQPGGIWTLTLKGDLKNKYYAYSVDTWNGSAITMDPYATACGACGIRGMIYDPSETNPDGWDNFTLSDIKTPQELTIYEVHIADFTGDSSWKSNQGNANGTYNAFVERGTTLTANDVDGTPRTVKTGFDHLIELGVGAVQLLPVFDSDNDEVNNKKYNWGYNPLNYNCVEGVYSSNPHDGVVRIREYKNMINELAKEDIRVIMDVVYNHVSSPSASCFNKLMPRYYFRYDENGELCDGSGCHNEFKSEATMARKFIIDSVCMWAREYNIKGFRFDLMGLLDVNTMHDLKKACYQIDPDIYLYGEGWDGGGGFHGGWDAQYGEQSLPTGYYWSEITVYSKLFNGPDQQECWLGSFNDACRNLIRGGNDTPPGYGFIQKGKDDVNKEGDYFPNGLANTIWGERADGKGGNPTQTVNYVSCHDNWTLRDQLYYTLGDGKDAKGNVYDVMHASETAHALIFASNAAAFMLGGEELLRTKDVDVLSEEQKKDILPNTYYNMYGHNISHNSYNSPIEVNSFKWGNKITVEIDGNKANTFEENITGKFADLISLHKEMPKYSYDEMPAKKQTTSAGKPVTNLWWNGGSKDDCGARNNKGVLGLQFDEYFVFVTCREWGYVSSDVSTWDQRYTAGTVEVDSINKSLNLGNLDLNNGFACRVYNRGGK